MTPSSEPIIEIVISPTGQTRIQTRGYVGSTCRQATAELEKALGLVESDQPTAEFYQPVDQQQDQHLHG